MTSERYGSDKIENINVDNFPQERLQWIFTDKSWAEDALEGGGAPEHITGIVGEGAKSYVRMLKTYSHHDKQMAYEDFIINYRLPLSSAFESIGIAGPQADRLGRRWYGAEQIIGSSLRIVSTWSMRDDLVAFDQWREGVDDYAYDLLDDYELEYLDNLQWIAYTRAVSLSGLEDSLRRQKSSLKPNELTAVMDSVRLSSQRRLHDALEHGNIGSYQLNLLIGRAFAYNSEALVQANYSLRDILG